MKKNAFHEKLYYNINEKLSRQKLFRGLSLYRLTVVIEAIITTLNHNSYLPSNPPAITKLKR
jgi:hypothetical protein